LPNETFQVAHRFHTRCFSIADADQEPLLDSQQQLNSIEAHYRLLLLDA